eukprot:scaffold46853_cov49-Attheya_sp.AAC.5
MEQYRMHPDISPFPNEQFYHGMLLDGVKEQKRPLPRPLSVWPSIDSDAGIVRKSCVAFIPTSGREVVTHNRSFFNKREVDNVVWIAEELVIKGGLAPGKLGMISPYIWASDRSPEGPPEKRIPVTPNRRKVKTDGIVEVNTVDAFQGSEKDDKRRMNDDLTRAKRGIIVVGDPNTLEHDPNWKAWQKNEKLTTSKPFETIVKKVRGVEKVRVVFGFEPARGEETDRNAHVSCAQYQVA